MGLHCNTRAEFDVSFRMQSPQPGFQAPICESRWNNRRERTVTVLCIGFTVLASVFTAMDQIPIWLQQLRSGEAMGAVGHALFLVIAALLVYGGLVYQITRLFYLRRLSRLRHHAHDESANPSPNAPNVTVLVPSYREEAAVIFQTLLSAALQEGATKRIALLIDDNPLPQSPEDQHVLEAARALPEQLEHLLGPMKRRMLELRAQDAGPAALATAFAECGEWFAAQAADALNGKQAGRDGVRNPSHTDRFFALEVLLERAHRAWDRSAHWEGGARHDDGAAEADWRLAIGWFEAEFTSFERKRFENLSHAPNKAMNLNSYIGLMGGTWCPTPGGQLRAADLQQPGGFHVPATDWILTLDADSLVLPGYVERLLGEVQASGNERIAVVQTPYSAVPAASGTLERVAGATTDVQYIIHQGFTAWNGTFWVGANALLRFAALRDVAVPFVERGHALTKFIQDRTVIEDTESTIDLCAKGWVLWNHPERLAYSATPADFGSLLIQRRRWANGGLLILPKALRYLRNLALVDRVRTAFFRVHYLVSITTVNLGLLVLLAFPLTRSVETFWLPLTAVPYFLLYGRDLRLMGYRRGDVFRVYALNVLLIPVNLGGVFKSLQQAVSGKHIPFARTPKVADRTPVHAPYAIAAFALMVQWAFGAAWGIRQGFASHAFFAAVNALVLGYAVHAFIGFRHAIRDVFRRP